MFKIAVVFVVFIFGSMGFTLNENMDPIVLECATENSISDVSTMKELVLTNQSRMNNHDYRCFLTCVARKSGITNTAGELDVEQIKQRLHPTEQSLRVITQCIENNKHDDICDRVAFAHICIIQEHNLH